VLLPFSFATKVLRECREADSAKGGNMELVETKTLLTVEEAAQRLSLSRNFIFRLIASGELTSIAVGRARRIPLTALVEFVRSRMQGVNERSSI
jgi:excisionase family DNA binding protein